MMNKAIVTEVIELLDDDAIKVLVHDICGDAGGPYKRELSYHLSLMSLTLRGIIDDWAKGDKIQITMTAERINDE